MAKPTRKNTEDLQKIVQASVEAAVKFMDEEIRPDRAKALKYIKGEVDAGAEAGRSKVVATKVRDTIRRVKPSLLRIFFSHDKPVEYVPTGPEDVAIADQATKYMHHKFAQLGGFRLLSTVIDDALAQKVGFLHPYWETRPRTTIHSFTGLTEEMLTLLLEEDGVEVIEHSSEIGDYPDPETGETLQMPLHDIKISRTTKRGQLVIDALPPGAVFVDENATGADEDENSVIGFRVDKTVGDLVAMGFDFDDVHKLGSFDDVKDDEEEEHRRGYNAKKRDEDAAEDPALRPVTVTVAYKKIDVDGIGIPVLHRFLMAGTGYKLLDHEPCDEIDLVPFEIDPVSHSFFGNSVFDWTKEDQDACTSVLRGILDNVQMVNSPRTVALEGMVNLDDLMNGEIGGIVREKAPNSVRDLTVPFVAGQTLPMLQYMDQMVEDKTGVTRASTGLDPDAMQSTTKQAVAATLGAAAAQIEVIARNIAEGGMIRLFKLLLRIMVKNCDKEELVRLNGNFVQIDPRVWNVEMDMQPNVGLGTGRVEDKAIALADHQQFQLGVLQTFGPQNGLVTLTHLRNTIADRLALAGYHNVDRYIAPMDPQIEQQLMAAQAQAAQAQQGQADPNAALAQAEITKAQIKAQTDTAKLQQQGQVDMAKLQLESQAKQAQINIEASKIGIQTDLKRDEMAQNLGIAQAELYAKSGVALDTARIKAEQAAPRDAGGNVR